MHVAKWIFCITILPIAGCSHYPIPEDISSLKTEQIVRFGRCEMRKAILNHMASRDLITNPEDEIEIKNKIDFVLNKINRHEKLNDKELHLMRLRKVAIVYSYDFNITEINKASAGATFKLPWLTEAFDAGVGGNIDLTRQGSRAFGAEDRWSDIIIDKNICKNTYQSDSNIIYPMTGSIGVGRVVETFVDIDEQGGAKDNFVDTLTFTTLIGGSANAGVTLDPAPKRIRPLSIEGSYGASRTDTHKLTISLAFPQQDAPRAIMGVTRVDGDLNAPFTRPADWRARYNLCVADARARENTFKSLRFEAPEVYCVRYADAFAPKYGYNIQTRRTTRGPRPAASSPAASSVDTGRTIMPRTQTTPRPAIPLPPTPLFIRPNAEL